MSEQHTPPVAKLPLAAAKSIRDKWEPKKPELEAAYCKLLGTSTFSIDLDIKQLFAYGNRINIGNDLFLYFEELRARISLFTQQGNDQEAQQVLRSLCFKNQATLLAKDIGESDFNKTAFEDGVLQLLYNPKYPATNIFQAGRDLEDVVDEYLESINQIPITALRVEKAQQTSSLKEAHEILQSTFGVAINVGYDLLEVVKTVKEAGIQAKHKDTYISGFNGSWRGAIIVLMCRYILAAAKNMRDKKVGEDEMIRVAWLQAAEKGIWFEVVTSLKNNDVHAVEFTDGYFKIQVQAARFGNFIDTVGLEVIDRL